MDNLNYNRFYCIKISMVNYQENTYKRCLQLQIFKEKKLDVVKLYSLFVLITKGLGEEGTVEPSTSSISYLFLKISLRLNGMEIPIGFLGFISHKLSFFFQKQKK